MLCPSCGHDNLPGADHCGQCQTSLTQEDVPVALMRSRIEKSLSRDRIETLKPVTAVSVGEETTLDVVIGQMRQRKIGCMLITDSEGRLSGIFTERDLINKVAGCVEDLTAEPVSRFMSQRPVTGHADQLLASALQQMKVGDLRYLPLVDESGRPRRIVSSRDIINYLTSLVLDVS
jgi:CBS domain-containing protein